MRTLNKIIKNSRIPKEKVTLDNNLKTIKKTTTAIKESETLGTQEHNNKRLKTSVGERNKTFYKKPSLSGGDK